MKCEKCIKNGILNELEEIGYTLPVQIKYCKKCNSYFINTNDFFDCNEDNNLFTETISINNSALTLTGSKNNILKFKEYKGYFYNGDTINLYESIVGLIKIETKNNIENKGKKE